MSRIMCQCIVRLEALENRRLLSASADALVLDALSAQPALVATPMVTTPNIVGTFTGSSTSSGEKGSSSLTIFVTSQSHTNHITGTANSKYPHQHTHVSTFTGKINGKSFTLNLSDGSVVQGTATNHGHTLSGTWINSSDASHGTFNVSR